MSTIKNLKIIALLVLFSVVSCTETTDPVVVEETSTTQAIDNAFANTIDWNNLPNYANQSVPNYITKDNTGNNSITDAGATLGRVLFYDKNLSKDNTIACASCHQQASAFSDLAQASIGVNGTTGRHSMRLVNARFADESKFFWDERAATLEAQTSQPIQDHIEMGFSGENGDQDLNALTQKLEDIDYYREMFSLVYGNTEITEAKIQEALGQFIRSIQSFDSKYDIGRAQANSDRQAFANFTAQENEGKQLFIERPEFNQNGVRIGGGLGCGGCHRAPEFDIDPNTMNNGVTETLEGSEQDLSNTRSPSLRDVFAPNGNLNGPFMHTGSFSTLESVLAHYNEIDSEMNNNLDRRLRPNGNLQKLQMTQTEIDNVVAFMKTLTGSDVYTNAKWSNPFDEN